MFYTTQETPLHIPTKLGKTGRAKRVISTNQDKQDVFNLVCYLMAKEAKRKQNSEHNKAMRRQARKQK